MTSTRPFARMRNTVLLGLAAASLASCGINSVPTAEENAKAKWADVEAQFQRRANLIPNLVEAVKGYAGHEKSTLEEVIKARNVAAKGEPDSASEQGLKIALDNLLALGEDYPDLRASENFQELQNELADIEDKLAAARRALNAAAAQFNTAREAFPAVLFASMLGFKQADFNTLDDSERGTVDQAPKVAFS